MMRTAWSLIARHPGKWCLLAGACLLAGVCRADCGSSVGGGGRLYPDRLDHAPGYDRTVSLTGTLECTFVHDQGHAWTLDIVAHAAQRDSARTYADVRELAWIYTRDALQLRAGIDQVFWGVAEFAHVVDVINQADVLADPFGLMDELASEKNRMPQPSPTIMQALPLNPSSGPLLRRVSDKVYEWRYGANWSFRDDLVKSGVETRRSALARQLDLYLNLAVRLALASDEARPLVGDSEQRKAELHASLLELLQRKWLGESYDFAPSDLTAAAGSMLHAAPVSRSRFAPSINWAFTACAAR